MPQEILRQEKQYTIHSQVYTGLMTENDQKLRCERINPRISWTGKKGAAHEVQTDGHHQNLTMAALPDQLEWSDHLKGEEGALPVPHDHLPHGLHEVAFLQHKVVPRLIPPVLPCAGHMEHDPVFGPAGWAADVPVEGVGGELVQEAVAVVAAEGGEGVPWQHLQEGITSVLGQRVGNVMPQERCPTPQGSTLCQ